LRGVLTIQSHSMNNTKRKEKNAYENFGLSVQGLYMMTDIFG